MASLPLAFVSLGACGNGDAGDTDAAQAVVFDAANAGDPDASGDARFLLRWTLVGGCLGGDEIETTVSSRFDGRTIVNRFPCTDTSGLSDPLSPGEFDVQVRVFDNDVVVPPDSGPVAGPLLAISEVSGPHASAVGTAVPVEFAFPTATATILTSWNFSEDTTSQTCAEAGVVNMALTYQRTEGEIERQVTIACADGSDSSGDLPTGLYQVRATALDAGGTPVFAQEETLVTLFVGNEALTASFAFSAAAQ